jgi:hypothetical protein
MILFAALARVRSDESLRVLRRAFGAERLHLDACPIARAVAQARYAIVCREIDRRERRPRDRGRPRFRMRLWS